MTRAGAHSAHSACLALAAALLIGHSAALSLPSSLSRISTWWQVSSGRALGARGAQGSPLRRCEPASHRPPPVRMHAVMQLVPHTALCLPCMLQRMRAPRRCLISKRRPRPFQTARRPQAAARSPPSFPAAFEAEYTFTLPYVQVVQSRGLRCAAKPCCFVVCDCKCNKHQSSSNLRLPGAMLALAPASG